MDQPTAAPRAKIRRAPHSEATTRPFQIIANNDIARRNDDPTSGPPVAGVLPNYTVSLAEAIILAAADLSERFQS